jgi:type IV secretion system protein VirD4
VDELSSHFDDLEPDSRGLRSYNLFRLASPNVQGNVIIGLGVRLAVMQNDEIAELMCYPDMDMLALGKEKTAYFLVLSDQDNTMRFVSAMFFSLLFLRLVQYADGLPDRRLPVSVNLILDELCSVVGAINGFHIKMSNVRSRAIHISFFIQSLGQLQNRYPDNMWSEILSAADTMLVMGCNDPISAQYVSDRSGEVTIYADTIMKQRSIFLPSILQPNYRHSEGAGRRKLLTMDEVLRMEPQKMLVMIRGQQLLEIDKFDYTRNPESRKFRPVSIRGLDMSQRPAVPASPPPSPRQTGAGGEAASKPVMRADGQGYEREAPAAAQRKPRAPRKEVMRDVSGDYQQMRFDDVGPESVKEAIPLEEKPKV